VPARRDATEKARRDARERALKPAWVALSERASQRGPPVEPVPATGAGR